MLPAMTDDQFDRLMTAILELGRRIDRLEDTMADRLERIEKRVRQHVLEDHAG